MKKRFVLLAVLLTVILIIPVLFLNYGKQASAGYLDNTVVNGLLNELSADWDNVKAKNRSTVPQIEGISYEVMDNDGRILVRTNTGMPEDLGRATSERYTIRDIKVDGEVVGKLLISNDFTSMRSETQKNYERRFIIVALVEALLIALFLLWVYRNIIKPFEDLKEFASDIASGDLDKPLKMDKGNIFGIFTESFDIMREELKASREREEKAVKSRKELVAQLSHDIKTPVSSIKAMTDVMSLTASEEDKVTINAINAKADQIDSLISNLFHATLEELEQLEVKPEDINSTDIVQMIKDADYQNKIEKLDIKDAVVFADRLRLNQVLNNIIFNSYKYADTGIDVTSRFENAGSKYLFIEIADKGPGVPEEELEMITQKFKRGSNAGNKDGSGLGLYISDYLMNKMEGSLSVRNRGDGFAVEIGIKIS